MIDRFHADHVRKVLSDPERLRALADTGLLATRAQGCLERWTEVAAEALGAEAALVCVLTAEHAIIKCASGVDGVERDAAMPAETSFGQYVLAGDGPLAVDDARHHPVLKPLVSTPHFEIVAHLGVPLLVDGQAVGALCALEPRPRRWTDADVRLLERLGEGLGLEIQLRASAVDLRRSGAILEAHNRIHEMIAGDAPIDAVMHEIVTSIEAYDPTMLATVMLLDPVLGTLSHVAAPRLPPGFLASIEGLAAGPDTGSCGAAADRGEVVIDEDLLADGCWVHHRALVEAHGLRHCWAYPITGSDGQVLGTFGVYGTRPLRPTPRDDGFIRDAARLAGIAIERRDTLDRLVHDATHDSLTGLPNRAALFERLARALARSRRSGATVAVMFADLDRFKILNDTLGHDVGDQVILDAAQRLAGSVRPGDTVARFGGEEFVMVAEDVTADEAAQIAERLHGALRRPIAGVASEQELTVTASLGVTLVRGDQVDPREAIRRADAAMYEAKEAGGNRTVLREELVGSAPHSRRLAVETALRHAISRGELSVAYQPLGIVADERIRAVEALARWHHPELGEVSPTEFIAVAEQTDLIHEIGAWVLRTACRAAGELSAALGHPVRMGVNVSPRQLRERQFTRTVADALAETGLRPDRLVVEITETAVLGSDAETGRTLRRLDELGVMVVIDDFGRGYSSLATLKRPEVKAIKIDRSFIEGLARNVEDRAIVIALIGMARGLGLYVAAEGVETVAQLQAVRDLGCDMAQGYLIGRPVTLAEALTEWPRHVAWPRLDTDAAALEPAPHRMSAHPR